MSSTENETKGNIQPTKSTKLGGGSHLDPTKLRLSQDYSVAATVKKVLNTVPVRKPGRQDYIRINPEPGYTLETMVLELKEDRETFLIDRPLWSELPGELIPKTLFTTVNRQKVLTLWPVRMPGEDGRLDEWNTSAQEAAEMAKTRWIRLSANMSLGAYDIFEAAGNLAEPEWPEISFQEILKIAFRGRFIDNMEHPAIRRLRGEV